MPGLTQRYALPRFLRRGVDESLTLDVYDSAGVQQTATVGTLSVFAGSRTVLDEVAVATLGPPAAYALAAAVTATEGLSDRWLEVWSLTIGGSVEVFQRPAYLVRRLLTPVIDDRDLSELHSDLAELRDPSQQSYAGQRHSAWIRLNKWLIQQGNRPALIFDSWGLRDVHIYLSLEIIFRDFATSVGDGRYSKLSDHYRQIARDEFDRLQLAYDFDEDGTNDSDAEKRSATPVTYLSSGWAGRWGGY